MKCENGFTLFELLIAIFIGTILIMSGSYAIRTGLFSLGREEEWFNDSTKEKAAFDFFWQQASSLRNQKIENKDALLTEGHKKSKKKKTIYFSGENDSLTFVSPLSLKKHYGQGLIIADYNVTLNEKGLWDLIYTEKRNNPTALTKLSENIENRLSTDKDNTIFLRDCDKISFAYLDSAGNETDSENEGGVSEMIQDDVIEDTNLRWKEKMSGKIPVAIKLSASKNGKEQELTTPIMVTYSFSASGQ